jgi:hypothetical protein
VKTTSTKAALFPCLAIVAGVSGGCDSGLQEPGEREPDEELDDGSKDFETLDVPDTRTIPYLCETDEACDDDDPCTTGSCNGRYCTYSTVEPRLAVQVIDTAAPALDVSLSSTRMYVAEGEFGIEAFDIGDLNAIAKAGSAKTEGEAISVEAHNNGVIVSEGEAGIETFSTGLDLITHIAADNGPLRGVENVQNVDIGPAYAVISGFSDGVLLSNFSDLGSPSREELINTGGRAVGAVSTNTMAVVADSLAGTAVVLLDDPAGPTAGIPVSTDGRVLDVDLRGDTVLMAEYGAGFGVATISDPALPVRLASYPSPVFIVAAGLLGTQTAAVVEWREEEERGRLALWRIAKDFTGRFQDGDVPIARPLVPESLIDDLIDGEPKKMDIREGIIAVATEEGVYLYWTGCAEE